MKHLVVLLSAAALTFGLAGCQNETPQPSDSQSTQQAAAPAATQPAAPNAMGYSGNVTETIDAAGYTYVQVDTGSETIWAAGPKVDVKVGDPVVIPQGMAMQDYHSKTLDRNFPVVYFVDSILVGGADAALPAPTQSAGSQMPSSTGTPAVADTDVDLTGIEAAEGGKTVAEVYEDPTGLAGKNVKIRGKVVKFNADIMGKNWLHIQDGTGADGTNDLTVTTDATAAIGDTVLVDGTLVTDKDFGYGYKYAVLIEDATVTVE